MEVRDTEKTRGILADWRSAPLTDREKALCAYADKLTRHPKDMSAADLEPLRAVGLGDAGILDLAQVVSYFNYINRIADGLGIDLESFMDGPDGVIAAADAAASRPSSEDAP